MHPVVASGAGWGSCSLPGDIDLVAGKYEADPHRWGRASVPRPLQPRSGPASVPDACCWAASCYAARGSVASLWTSNRGDSLGAERAPLSGLPGSTRHEYGSLGMEEAFFEAYPH